MKTPLLQQDNTKVGVCRPIEGITCQCLIKGVYCFPQLSGIHLPQSVHIEPFRLARSARTSHQRRRAASRNAP